MSACAWFSGISAILTGHGTRSARAASLEERSRSVSLFDLAEIEAISSYP
jgi:hypothetical protein